MLNDDEQTPAQQIQQSLDDLTDRAMRSQNAYTDLLQAARRVTDSALSSTAHVTDPARYARVDLAALDDLASVIDTLEEARLP